MSIILTGTDEVVLTLDSDVELVVNVEYTDVRGSVRTDHAHDFAIEHAGASTIVPSPPQGATRTVTALTVSNQQRAGQNAATVTAAGSSVFTGTLQSGDTVAYAAGVFTHTTSGGDGHSGNGNSSPSVSGAMVVGQNDTNLASISGQFLTICPTVVYDTDGYVDNTDPTETALRAPTDGLYLVTFNTHLTGLNGRNGHAELILSNNGADNNWKTRVPLTSDGADGAVLALTQVVRLLTHIPMFATIVYDLDFAVDVSAVMDASTGGWTITKLGSYPT